MRLSLDVAPNRASPAMVRRAGTAMQKELQALEPTETAVEIDLAGIMRMIPHRYPFLMIDKVVDIIPGQSAVGIKCVTATEPHFQGHFPNQPLKIGRASCRERVCQYG